MAIIKKLDLFILKKFALIFVGAFFICLFVFMMQFTWRYVDELIGKGLSLEILAQFYWYMGITLIPTSLPLAILLASLITFGNLGEQLELLAMKAAGVPLIRIMKPIFVVVFLLASTSFVFQNYMSPQAQISLRTLLFSMKQTSPAVEIPEGVFYSGVPNINLYVQHKNAETGMLYEVIIYRQIKALIERRLSWLILLK
jgi:lipopolysaccharide export system permease protein